MNKLGLPTQSDIIGTCDSNWDITAKNVYTYITVINCISQLIKQFIKIYKKSDKDANKQVNLATYRITNEYDGANQENILWLIIFIE